jgi:hypothetical protein
MQNFDEEISWKTTVYKTEKKMAFFRSVVISSRLGSNILLGIIFSENKKK